MVLVLSKDSWLSVYNGFILSKIHVFTTISTRWAYFHVDYRLHILQQFFVYPHPQQKRINVVRNPKVKFNYSFILGAPQLKIYGCRRRV